MVHGLLALISAWNALFITKALKPRPYFVSRPEAHLGLTLGQAIGKCKALAMLANARSRNFPGVGLGLGLALKLRMFRR